MHSSYHTRKKLERQQEEEKKQAKRKNEQGTTKKSKRQKKEATKKEEIEKEKKIKEGLELIKERITYEEAPKKVGIAASTLRYRFVNNNVVKGHYFDDEQEKVILNFIQERQQGNPLTKQEILNIINDYLKVIYIYIFNKVNFDKIESTPR